MTEVCNPEAIMEPESIGLMIDAKFEQAASMQASGVEGYLIEHYDAKAQYVRLFKQDGDYDLMIGRPMPGSETPQNVEYWIITLRWRNYVDKGNEDMLVLKGRPDKIYEDIGGLNNGSTIDSDRTTEMLDFIRHADLRDLSELARPRQP